MKSFEYIDHTADIAVKACGRTVAESFSSAAEALFAVITGEAEIGGDKPVSFDIESVDRDGLLVGMLSELILRHEVDQVVLSDFTVRVLSETSLHCECMSTPFEKAKHGNGVHVKGVSYHMLEIHESTDDCWVQVLFDV